MHDLSILFHISARHTMRDQRVSERQARFWEAMSTRDAAPEAPATPTGEPKKRGLLRLIEAAHWPIR